MDISEDNFEQSIETTLLAGGSDSSGVVAADAAPGPFGKFAPGRYRKRKADDYDRALPNPERCVGLHLCHAAEGLPPAALFRCKPRFFAALRMTPSP
jgi:hypothetical protein